MSIFKPTKEELDKASKGRESIEWKNGEQPTLLLKEFKELPDKNLDIFVTTVVGGEHDGKEQPLFFRTNNEYDMEDAIKLALQFFTYEELSSGNASSVDMIGHKVSCKVKLSKSKDGEKTFTNFQYYKKVDDAPVLQAVSNSDIPF